MGLVIDKIKFAIDQNPKKIGGFLSGTGIPIKSKNAFFDSATSGDLVVISNPVYADEIRAEIESSGLTNIEIEIL